MSMVLAMRADSVDLEVYRAGGEAVLAGRDLYNEPVWYDFRFTYPPFAALVFTPLSPLSAEAARILVALLNTSLLVFIVARSWRSLGLTRTHLLVPAVIAVSGASFALESVHSNFIDGQINLLLVALVLADLTGPTDHPLRGVGVGLAAALKLTPLIFVAYLIVTRKYRQAAVASGTAAGTVLVSFLLVPAATTDYWLRGMFADLSRIHVDLASRHNQSLRGLLLKNGVPETPALWLWLVFGATVGVAGLTLAAWAARRGERLLGASLCGLCAAAVSPWSWGHHWVWLVPLEVFLLSAVGRPDRRGRWLPTLVLVACALPGVLALADPMDDDATPVLADGPLAFVLANFYMLIFMTVLAAAVADLRGRRTPPAGQPPGSLIGPATAHHPHLREE
ncbi:glycosyltransferase 87 family protein [Streptomyces sparsogenes]|uniref:glycosyltransferase 87 family protein n=1 Tax=Streptomyces sparsogenes TaxID=67365 RepID=UPI0033DED4A5